MKIYIETLKGYENVKKRKWYVDTTDGKLHGARGIVKGSWSRSRRYPYNSVTLQDENGKKIHKRLDRIIGSALVPGRTEKKNEIDHIDGSHSNDSPDNLEWVTREENMRRCRVSHKYNMDENQIKMTIGRSGEMTEKTISAIRKMHRQNSGVQIKIKTFGSAKLPEKISKGDWIDLRAHGNYKLKRGEQCYIMLGVAMELPEGYEAYVVPRSSMTKRFGIIQANSPGIIDHSFCGDSDEWGLSVVAIRDTEIMDGDRVCQFRIQKSQPEIRFEKVEHLNNPSRGGWGSTGRR